MENGITGHEVITNGPDTTDLAEGESPTDMKKPVVPSDMTVMNGPSSIEAENVDGFTGECNGHAYHTPPEDTQTFPYPDPSSATPSTNGVSAFSQALETFEDAPDNVPAGIDATGVDKPPEAENEATIPPYPVALMCSDEPEQTLENESQTAITEPICDPNHAEGEAPEAGQLLDAQNNANTCDTVSELDGTEVIQESKPVLDQSAGDAVEHFDMTKSDPTDGLTGDPLCGDIAETNTDGDPASIKATCDVNEPSGELICSDAHEEELNDHNGIPGSKISTASIDVGKFGAISLSTQLSSNEEDQGNLSTAMEKLDNTETDSNEAAMNEGVGACDTNATNEEAALPQAPALRELMDDVFGSSDATPPAERAVGAERRSTERVSETPPGHIEIDLSSQLENIFTGDNKPPRKLSDIGEASGSDTERFKDDRTAPEGEDEFDTLDKEIEMLRDSYRSTQTRIQKALSEGKEEDSDYKRFRPPFLRTERLGSAPVQSDYTPSRACDPDDITSFRTKNVGARRMVEDQSNLVKKLQKASASFDEIEGEIRNLKYEMLENQVRRSRFFEEIEQDLFEDEEEDSYKKDYSCYNPYYQDYVNPRTASSSLYSYPQEEEFEFRLPSSTRRPWSSHGGHSRSFALDDREMPGYHYVPPPRPSRFERATTIDTPKAPSPESPPSYRPGKATSEFLRQIYAKNNSSGFEFEDDFEDSTWTEKSGDDLEEVRQSNRSSSKSYNYNYDAPEREAPLVKSERERTGNKKYMSRSMSSAADFDLTTKSSSRNWDDMSGMSSLPRTRSSRNWDVSPQRGGKSKTKDAARDISPPPYEKGSKYGGNKSERAFSSRFLKKRNEMESEKPAFTSRFLQKRQSVKDQGEDPGSGRSKDKPFRSRFLRKSVDLGSLGTGAGEEVAKSEEN